MSLINGATNHHKYEKNKVSHFNENQGTYLLLSEEGVPLCQSSGASLYTGKNLYTTVHRKIFNWYKAVDRFSYLGC